MEIYKIPWPHLSLIIITLFSHHGHQVPVFQRCLTFPSAWHRKNCMCQIHGVCEVHTCIFLCKSAWPCSICRVGRRSQSWVSSLTLYLVWDKVPFVVHCPVCQASWPSSFQGSPVPTSHFTRGAGITEVCYHAQLHLGFGQSNSGLHNFTESIPPTEPPPWPRTVQAMSVSLLAFPREHKDPSKVKGSQKRLAFVSFGNSKWLIRTVSSMCDSSSKWHASRGRCSEARGAQHSPGAPISQPVSVSMFPTSHRHPRASGEGEQLGGSIHQRQVYSNEYLCQGGTLWRVWDSERTRSFNYWPHSNCDTIYLLPKGHEETMA